MTVQKPQVMAAQTSPGPNIGQASSQDTPQALKTWWAGFKHKKKKEDPKVEATPARTPGIFGIPLADSIKYANVAISLINERGESFTYGYVPIVVAKCGVFLKEKATDVEGIFRLNGSAKRIKELQTAFDSPDRYGKGLDWTGYTVHDAANVLRRYLNNLPQPIVPLEFYERFREPLRGHFNHGGTDSTVTESNDLDHDQAITTYQKLITEIPPLNRQLLLYILDLLAVFASKSEVNLMTSANLAAIFQPGVLSHPTHDMSPADYRLSQDVLIFLIDNQDSFLIGMSGTAADEKTVREVQSGSVPQQPSTPSKTGLGRSSSNASGADSKRFSGVRRNVSTSSRTSRQSSQGPATPLSGRFEGSGIHRSNTLPSKKSPALPSSRFSRGGDSPSTPGALSPTIGSGNRLAPLTTIETKESDQTESLTAAVAGLGLTQANTPTVATTQESNARALSPEQAAIVTQNPSQQTKNRKVSDVLLNLTAGNDKDGRQPNKLKKKRIPSALNASGNSSTASLVGAEQFSPSIQPARSPLRTPDVSTAEKGDPMSSIIPDPTDVTPTGNEIEPKTPVAVSGTGFAGNEFLSPDKPRAKADILQSTESGRARSDSHNSANSKSSITDLSEVDHDQAEEARAEQKEKKRRWRFSHSAKKASKSPARVGSDAVAGQSSSSIASWHRSRKSISNEANPMTFETTPSLPATTTTITGGTPRSRSKSKDHAKDLETEEEKEEKRGFFDKLKAKVTQAREEKKERDAEKERAKSPQRDSERSGSKHSLSAIANDVASSRRPSVVQPAIPEQADAGTVESTENKEGESKAVVAEQTLIEAPLPVKEAGETLVSPPTPSADPVVTNQAPLEPSKQEEPAGTVASNTNTSMTSEATVSAPTSDEASKAI